MKRISRTPEIISLFEEISRAGNLKIQDPTSQKEILDRISSTFKKCKENPIFVHGHRTESMFEYVVAALGEVSLIKREDVGNIFCSNKTIRPPDFSILLKDGTGIFVEVKNFHKYSADAIFSIRNNDFEELCNYAKLFKQDLYFAIYWSCWGAWTLIAIDDFEQKEKPSITFPEAMKKNKMSLLGDLMVGTTPPLSYRLFADRNKPRVMEKNGAIEFTIGGFEIYCNGLRIEEEIEKKLALYFIFYSDWEANEPEAKFERDQLDYIEQIFLPKEGYTDRKIYLFGFLSQMISRHYKEATSEDGVIHRLSPIKEPEAFSIGLSKNYKGKQLGLAIITVKANNNA
ncbi:hypothetical protein LLG95_02780 [bacterium]|nr:hypothetical protein [bacterium]